MTFGRLSLYSFYSHTDNYAKRHSNRHQESRVLWMYGSIPFTGIPFIVKNCQERQCEYGLPKCRVKRNTV